MKKHTKATITLMLGIITLTSCSGQQKDAEAKISDQSTSFNQNSELISYYEAEISKLEESMLDIKEEYYISSKEYQDEIDMLKEQLQSNNSTTQQSPDMEDVSVLPFSYISNNGEATIIKYTGISANVTVPSELQGYTVTKIGEYAFNSDIESIIISEGIKEIDWFAFAGCSRLVEIYIPMSVTMINYGAFDYCPKALVIKCKKGSYAEAYAKSYGLNCIAE